jgi:hypothetical protein
VGALVAAQLGKDSVHTVGGDKRTNDKEVLLSASSKSASLRLLSVEDFQCSSEILHASNAGENSQVHAESTQSIHKDSFIAFLARLRTGIRTAQSDASVREYTKDVFYANDRETESDQRVADSCNRESTVLDAESSDHPNFHLCDFKTYNSKVFRVQGVPVKHRRISVDKSQIYSHAFRTNVEEKYSEKSKLVSEEFLSDLISKYNSNKELSEKDVNELVAPYNVDNSMDLEFDPDAGIEAFDLLDTPSDEEFNTIFKLAIEKAVKNMELTEEQSSDFSSLVSNFKDVFSIRMGLTVPADVAPLKVQLIPDAKPLRVKLRSYTPEDTQFMKETCDEMIKLGLLYHNKDARWVAPVLVVPKPGSKAKRMTIDLRYINTQTVPIQYGMPRIEDQLPKLKDAKYFFTGDFLKGFWQVLVDKESQHLFSFMTPGGVLTPTRLSMGAVDSPLYFQATLEEVFRNLISENKLLLWIDDILGVAKTFPAYLALLRDIFVICRKHKLKLNVEKCVLGGLKAEWCGRVITGTGVTMKSRKCQAFETMPIPTTAGELGEFLHALNWMRSSIPRFQEASAILWDKLREAKQFLLAYKHNKIDSMAKASKKANYKNVKLSLLGWDDSHSQAFLKVRDSLCELTELAYFDPNDLTSTVCLLTDASQRHYSALLTQVRKWDPSKLVEDQEHEPLGSFNGEFLGSAVKWSTIEKESFPIIKALQEFRYMLSNSKGFRLYTDHANLVNLFRPDNLSPPLSGAALDKVYRWLYTLSHFRIISMQHLPGVRNIWADLLSRWGHPTYRKDVVHVNAAKVNKKFQLNTVSNEFLNLQYAYEHSNFDMPSREKLISVQQTEKLGENDLLFLQNNQNCLRIDNDLIYYKDKIWIPCSERLILLCIMITAHDSHVGHNNIAQTKEKIKCLFYWQNMDKDIHDFVFHCLACSKTKDGSTIPRPWGRSIVASRFGEVIHFDYLYIDKSIKSRHYFEYILVLKDNFTNFVELIACEHADHYNVVTALQSWQARFGPITTLVSDQGSHFCNLVMEEYVKSCFPSKVKHHFTMSYSPWSNGTVERVNRDIISLFKKIVLNSREVDIDSWPFLLPHVMSHLNGRKQDTLGKHSPRELVVGRSDHLDLDILFDSKLDKIKVLPGVINYDTNFSDLCDSLCELHRDVVVAKDKIHTKNVNDKKVQVLVNFGIGDFVLIALVSKKQRKLHAQWRGPYRVIHSVSSHVYTVEDLVSNVLVDVHVTRMKFFATSDMNVTIALKDVISGQDSWNLQYIPEVILDSVIDTRKQIFVQVKWSGFSELESTWEPIKSFLYDAPELVTSFLANHLLSHGFLHDYVKKHT